MNELTNELAMDLEKKVATVAPEKRHILLCGGIPCRSLRCREVKEAVLAELQQHDLENKIKVLETGWGAPGTVPNVLQGLPRQRTIFIYLKAPLFCGVGVFLPCSCYELEGA